MMDDVSYISSAGQRDDGRGDARHNASIVDLARYSHIENHTS